MGEIPLDKCSLATTSWEEFLSGTFADFRDYDEIVPQDIEEAAKLNDPDDLYAENGRAFQSALFAKISNITASALHENVYRTRTSATVF